MDKVTSFMEVSGPTDVLTVSLEAMYFCPHMNEHVTLVSALTSAPGDCYLGLLHLAPDFYLLTFKIGLYLVTSIRALASTAFVGSINGNLWEFSV